MRWLKHLSALLKVENKDETVSKAIYSYCNQKLTGQCSNMTSWMYMQTPSITLDSWTSASAADGARRTQKGGYKTCTHKGNSKLCGQSGHCRKWRRQSMPPPYPHHQKHFSGLFKFLLCIRHRRNMNQISHFRHVLKPFHF